MAGHVKLGQLKSQLEGLKKSGVVVQSDVMRTHGQLYRHLAEIYLWWRDAEEQHPDYLRDQYKLIGRKFKSLKYGYNFRPLLFLVYGNNAGLDKNYLRSYSGTLNAVNDEYNQRPELYEKNAVVKIAQFIDESGGVGALAGYDPDEEDSGGQLSSVDQKRIDKLEKTARGKMLRHAAQHDFETDHPLLSAGDYLPADDNKYSLMLVQKTRKGLQLVGVLNDAALTQTCLIENYKRRFDAADRPVRPLLELLQTQCLPKQLAGISKALIDKSVLDGWGKEVFQAHRRVLFRHKKGEFVLSPMNAKSGVVSVVTPELAILKATERDVYLDPHSRELIERKCLQPFAFNYYQIGDSSGRLEIYPEKSSASHVAVLSHLGDAAEFFGITFWPFYNLPDRPQGQVIVDESFASSPTWQMALTKEWFQKLSDVFLDPWLNGHAKLLKRDKNGLLKLEFKPDELTINFLFEDGKFEENETVKFFVPSASKVRASAVFLSKDIVPALRSIAYLPVASNILVELYSSKLVISFHTGERGCSHQVNIPVCDEEGKRSTKGFAQYKPEFIDFEPLAD